MLGAALKSHLSFASDAVSSHKEGRISDPAELNELLEERDDEVTGLKTKVAILESMCTELRFLAGNRGLEIGVESQSSVSH